MSGFPSDDLVQQAAQRRCAAPAGVPWDELDKHQREWLKGECYNTLMAAAPVVAQLESALVSAQERVAELEAVAKQQSTSIRRMTEAWDGDMTRLMGWQNQAEKAEDETARVRAQRDGLARRLQQQRRAWNDLLDKAYRSRRDFLRERDAAESSLRLCQEDRDAARAELGRAKNGARWLQERLESLIKETDAQQRTIGRLISRVHLAEQRPVIPDDAEERLALYFYGGGAGLKCDDIKTGRHIAGVVLAEVRSWVGPAAQICRLCDDSSECPEPGCDRLAGPSPAVQGEPAPTFNLGQETDMATYARLGGRVPVGEPAAPVPAEQPDPEGGIDLTDEEFASFLASARGAAPSPAVPDTAPSARPTTELSTRVSDSVAGRSAGDARDTFVSPTADERAAVEIPAWVEVIEKFIAAVTRGVDADSCEGTPLWEWEPAELEDWALSVHAMTGPAVDALDAALAPAPAPDYNRHCTNCGARYVPITCTVCGAGPTTSLAAPTPVVGWEANSKQLQATPSLGVGQSVPDDWTPKVGDEIEWDDWAINTPSDKRPVRGRVVWRESVALRAEDANGCNWFLIIDSVRPVRVVPGAEEQRGD